MIPFNQYALYQAGESCDPRPLLGGAAVGLNGVVGDYVEFNGTNTINSMVSGVWTLSLWFYNKKTTGNSPIITDGGISQKIGLYLAGSKWYLIYSGVIDLSLNHNLSVNTWYHITVSFDGNFNIWVDGVKVVDDYDIGATLSPTNSAGNYTISTPTAGASNALNANVFGVSVHGGVASQDMVDDLYSGAYDYSVNTYFLAKLDERSGSTCYDSAGNGYDGTLTGGSWVTGLNTFSFSDNYGYSKPASVYIPRDESNKDFDVLGNSLEFKNPACGI